MKLFKWQRKKRWNKAAAGSSSMNLLLQTSEPSDSKTIDNRSDRSTPSKRCLKSDRSSGPELQALPKEGVEDGSLCLVKKTWKSNGKLERRKDSRNNKKNYIEIKIKSSNGIPEIDSSHTNSNAHTIPINYQPPADHTDSKLSVQSKTSSDRQLQNILQKLVKDNSISVNEVALDKLKTEGLHAMYRYEGPSQQGFEEAPLYKMIFPSHSRDNFPPHDNPFPKKEPRNGKSPRYEMNDPNEISKIISKRQKKRSKYSLRVRGMLNKSKEETPKLSKNCEITPQYEVSSGSTVSMSSCSMDSMLDDPRRLEMYREIFIMNEAPPPLPSNPRRFSCHFDADACIQDSWAKIIMRSTERALQKADSLVDIWARFFCGR